MNMPGFTAEESLYKTRRHYHTAGNLTQTDGVYPAFTISDLLRGTSRLGVARVLAEACCSSCYHRCSLLCLYARDPRNYHQCFLDCAKPYCTRQCNASKFGGCDQLL